METTISIIKLDKLVASKNNPRKIFDETKLKELAESIASKGILTPITVRPLEGKKDIFEIVCGERRYRASKLAKLSEIPAFVRELDERQALETQIIENLQREDVHPLEEAEGYEALMAQQKDVTVDDIAAKVGKSRGYVYGRLKLCELIPENRKLFYGGKFSPSVALLVARVPKDLQKEVGKAILDNDDYGINEPMSYGDAKEYIERNFMLLMKEASWDPKEKGLANKASCLECPKRTSNQKELFADIQGADRCTDPECFNAKKQASIQRKLAELRKSGKKFIPPDETEKALRHNSNYIKIEDTCYQAGTLNKRPTYRDLAKKAKDTDIIYAVNPHNDKLIELITKPEAARILKKLGIKKDSSTATRGEKIGEHKKGERVSTERTAFFVGKISQHMDQRVKNVLTLSAILNSLGRGWGVDDEILDKHLEGILGDDFEELYNFGDETVKKLIERALQLMPSEIKNIEQLDFLAAKLGYSLAKDYVITKEYLEDCTKDELVKLIKELGISFAEESTAKKDVLVEYIFKHAPKGKVPKELTI